MQTQGGAADGPISAAQGAGITYQKEPEPLQAFQQGGAGLKEGRGASNGQYKKVVAAFLPVLQKQNILEKSLLLGMATLAGHEEPWIFFQVPEGFKEAKPKGFMGDLQAMGCL